MPHRSEAPRILEQLLHKRLLLLATVVILVWTAASILAPLIAPLDPLEMNVEERLASPSPHHWLGVDGLGRDVLSRLPYGCRVSLPVAGVVAVAASLFGTLYSAMAADLGGWLNEFAMRIVDMVLAFPSLILAMAVAAALGPSIENSMLALLAV